MRVFKFADTSVADATASERLVAIVVNDEATKTPASHGEFAS